MTPDEYRGALERIARAPGCPKPIYNIAADALCWAREFEPSEFTVPSVGAEPDPEHCPKCAAFFAKPAEPVEVKNECWDAARLKVRQLEREIHSSSLSSAEKSDMLHTHSKLWMFATDAWDQEVIRPAQRKARCTETARCFHVEAGKRCTRYLEGADAERAAIVAFLRAEADRSVKENPGANWDYESDYVVTLRRVATRIEKNEHRCALPTGGASK